MNRWTRLAGTRLPLIQAPMAGVQDHRLAAAAGAAGALASLPVAMLTPEALRDQFEALRAVHDGPVNLNFFCHVPPQPDPAREAGWRAALAPFHAEWGIDPATIPSGPGRTPFDAPMAALLAELRPEVVSFHFGLPEQALLDAVRATGARVIASATTCDEAVWLARQGVDAVIAQGLEAGGHRGTFLPEGIDLFRADIAQVRAMPFDPLAAMPAQPGLFALLPQVVRAVPVPVIAAGGIADAAGVRAAFALGASAVQVGTAFLCCDEARTSDLHRAALRGSAADRTALTNVYTGRPARGLVTRLMRERGLLDPLAPAFPLAGAALAPLRAAAEAVGCADFSPLWSGQNASGCRAVPAAEVVRSLFDGVAWQDAPAGDSA
ncbi:NAD(P)H-dependent flavin oxidoreductase [Leptothrix discophora]|uniref:Propionate 3-nitronate monooxygenase n=1 Tax=Leptothrix discophora TaxID=89 RepID=A0ABT9G0G4_LEPDI|nr:nitronate monooxygenase [Leptothrix discophora]MDP4299969.1 nitronate monooxygenase [Leptothrix discophora]